MAVVTWTAWLCVDLTSFFFDFFFFSDLSDFLLVSCSISDSESLIGCREGNVPRLTSILMYSLRIL